MRKHMVKCQSENECKIEEVQYQMNKSATIYIERILEETGLTKEEKLHVIDALIRNMTK